MKTHVLVLTVVIFAASCRWSTPRIKTNYRPCEIALGDSYKDVEQCLGGLQRVGASELTADYECIKGPLRFALRFDEQEKLIGFNAIFYGNTSDTLKVIELLDLYFSGLKSFYERRKFRSEGDDTYLKKLDINRPDNTLTYRVEVIP